MASDPESGRLIKSVDRIRDLGEVFTPATTIAAMLDMLPSNTWGPHPSATVLEPACGDGNFLVAVLERKLDAVRRAFKEDRLPAGTDIDALTFHGLEALSAIYGVDISRENILGGVPGHEFGARHRLLELMSTWQEDVAGDTGEAQTQFSRAAQWIVDRNVQIGDMLRLMADCPAEERRDIWIIEYVWMPASGEVSVAPTSLSVVLQRAEDDRNGVLSLFDAQPAAAWTGRPLRLSSASVPSLPTSSGAARNELARSK